MRFEREDAEGDEELRNARCEALIHLQRFLACGVFREALNREFCALPFRRDQCHPMTSYRTVIDSLIALDEVAGSALRDITLGAPTSLSAASFAPRSGGAF